MGSFSFIDSRSELGRQFFSFFHELLKWESIHVLLFIFNLSSRYLFSQLLREEFACRLKGLFCTVNYESRGLVIAPEHRSLFRGIQE